MSGIAEILLNQGFDISGSDLNQSENTDYLEKIGAKIHIGHSADNIGNSEVVVYSSAVKPETNPETAAAAEKKIPILRRAEMLAEVSRLNYTIAVSGTHGKTTTTSMAGLVLMKSGVDPTVIVGGRLKDLGGTNARLGKGEWTVVEADEYDRSFLQLTPTIAVINNIETEHMDIYRDFADLKDTFTEFANKVPFYGVVALGLDDPGVKEIFAQINKKIVTYGLSRHCDIRADSIRFEGRTARCTVYESEIELGELAINIPGIHNIKNALAAVTVARQLGIEFNKIALALSEFNGVFRRFEIKGERNGTIVIDDYAHHPTEVKSTLKAARRAWKDRRIICVFQPHTFSRTKALAKEFGMSFDDADLLVITDIYPAREQPIEGITGKTLADAALQSGHGNVKYIQDFNTLPFELSNMAKENDVLITMGAGNIWKISDIMVKE